jgi:lipoprotein-releasing system permease protein
MKHMEAFIAFRYLRGKRRTGFISIITWFSAASVFLGTLVLVVALSIANGFEKEVRDRIVGTLAHAKIMQYHAQPITNYDSLCRVVLQHPQVVAASPYITGKGVIEHEQIQEGVMILGVDDSLEPSVTDLKKVIKFGDLELDTLVSNRDRKFPGIVVGIGLADKMGVRPGSEAVLLTLVTTESGIDPVPMAMRFTIAGIFETGMYEYDVNLVYISIESAQELFNVRGVEGIHVRTADLFGADKTARELTDLLGGYPYRAVDWKAHNKSLFEWMNLEKFVIFFVISLIILIASFNIVSSLIMTILQKKREIGILMSMGATSGSVMKIFMLNGTIGGFIGSTAGTFLGFLICYIQYRWQLIPLPGDIYFIDKLPVLIRAVDVAAVYLTANIICWLATIYPSWSASKLLPAESIRYE